MNDMPQTFLRWRTDSSQIWKSGWQPEWIFALNLTRSSQTISGFKSVRQTQKNSAAQAWIQRQARLSAQSLRSVSHGKHLRFEWEAEDVYTQQGQVKYNQQNPNLSGSECTAWQNVTFAEPKALQRLRAALKAQTPTVFLARFMAVGPCLFFPTVIAWQCYDPADCICIYIFLARQQIGITNVC